MLSTFNDEPVFSDDFADDFEDSEEEHDDAEDHSVDQDHEPSRETGDQAPDVKSEIDESVNEPLVIPDWLVELNSVMFWSDLAPTKGQISYTLVSIQALIKISRQLFRYESRSGYFDSGDISGQNYWKVANKVNGFGQLGIWSLAAITQLLSLFGIAPTVNMMVWQYGVGVGIDLVFLSYAVLEFIAYENAF